jgi:hypothetical protein
MLLKALGQETLPAFASRCWAELATCRRFLS